MYKSKISILANLCNFMYIKATVYIGRFPRHVLVYVGKTTLYHVTDHIYIYIYMYLY